MSLLTIIIPCYNEAENITPFYEAVLKERAFFESNALDLEFLYIDDGSTDDTVSNVRKLMQTDNRIHILEFSRNFGKEAAMFAGLENATGDYVVVMDADLQDPPSLLPTMFEEITKNGYDCVATRRVNRKGEPPIRSFFARRFYHLINKMSKTEIVDGARDYRMMTRQFVNSILDMREYNRFSKGIFGWIGYKTKWIEYENIERMHGETKWSFWKLFLYACEGIVAFSTAPLAIAALTGVVFCFLAIIFIVVIIIRTFVYGDPTSGWPSLVCIILLVSGVQLFCIGIIGQYLSKTYLEVKNRPIYILKSKE